MCRRCRVVLFCLGRAVRRSRRIRRACYFPLAGLLPRAFLKLPSVFARQNQIDAGDVQGAHSLRTWCQAEAAYHRTRYNHTHNNKTNTHTSDHQTHWNYH